MDKKQQGKFSNNMVIVLGGGGADIQSYYREQFDKFLNDSISKEELMVLIRMMDQEYKFK